MKITRFIGCLCLLGCLSTASFAQEVSTETNAKNERKWTFKFAHHPNKEIVKPRSTYFTFMGHVGMFAGSQVKIGGDAVHSNVRFTQFFQMGPQFNINFSRKIGMFTGLEVKNLGFIAKEEPGVKIKRRVYTLGVPVAFKIGDVNGTNYFYFGGQYDLAMNYKEKTFVDGKKVDKFNEWFSDRTPLWMPSLFVGVRFNQFFGIRAQYYPQNFMNTDFTLHKPPTGVDPKPYQDYRVRVAALSFTYEFGKASRCDCW